MAKELDQLRTTATRLSHGLSQSVKALAEAGTRYLLAAHSNKFEDLSYLQKSYESLTKALQRDRQNAQLYIQLGYLCILVEDYQNAYKFFKTLLGLKPGHPDALIFMDYLKFRAPELFPELKTATQSLGLVLPPSESEATKVSPEMPDNLVTRASKQETRKENETTDLDLLYEKVEKRIYQKVQSSMRLHLPKMSMESNELKILETHEEQISLLILELHQNLEQLEKEMDVTELQQRLRPLEQQLERIQATLELSRLFRRLRSQISKVTRETVEAHSKLDKNMISQTQGEQYLENFLDRCDAIADELEELESRGHEISLLEKPYQRMISIIESFQEKLDEA